MSSIATRPQAHGPRLAAVVVVAVMIAFLVQTALLPALGLSAAVPVVLATVTVLGMALGPRVGAFCGFAAGLLLDLTGVGVLGVGALVGCLLGAYAGSWRISRWRWSGLPLAWAATTVAAVAFTVLNALIAGLPLHLSITWLWIPLGALASAVVLVPLRPWIRAVVR